MAANDDVAVTAPAEDEMLSTVKKVGPVLALFSRDRPELRMTDIARALDMPKSSTHALVTTLADVGLLSVSPRGHYRLGWNLLALAEQMRAAYDYSQLAKPAMERLQREFRETVLLGAPDRNEVIYVERVEGTHPTVRLAGARVGTSAPAHCTAAGKALLAYRESRGRRALLSAQGLKAMTKNTITSIDELEEELAHVRSTGVAYDRREIVSDVACIAAPVFDDDGDAVAAVSISMPFYRFEPRRAAMIEPLKTAAK